MNEEQIKALWMDYLAGELSELEIKELMTALSDHPGLEQELKEQERLWSNMEELSVPAPGPQLREQFYEMLEREEGSTKATSFWSMAESVLNTWLANRTALAMFSLILGIFIGYLLQRPSNNSQLAAVNEELTAVRKMMMLNLIEQPSVHDRLKAVNLSSEITESDMMVVEALLTTLNTDPNVNVRLAAAEALKSKADYPEVREGLVLSIGQQESPLLLIALADIMISLKEKRSVDELQKLLDKDDIDEAVKNRLKQTIEVLI